MKLELRKIGWLAGVVFTGLFMSSCLNDNGDIDIPDEGGYVGFINASPDSGGLDFYENDIQRNHFIVDYGDVDGYHILEPGTKTITVKNGNSSDLDTLSLNVNLNRFYSIYAVNEFDSLQLVAYEDNYTIPSPGKASMRFIQLSPDAPALRFLIEGNNEESLIYQYLQSSAFTDVNQMINKKLYLIDAETNDTILTKNNVTFQSGVSYSVFSKGFYNSDVEGQQLDVQITPFQ
ncbi:MAG TPA: DUF4397 domain-containing protein [Moheibacter sp.]|nr:DUF4397 domain-containing protein [Moheibacter sp.]